VNFKKSSHELAVQTNWYLTYSILGTWFVKVAHKNKICPKNGPTRGASFYIGLNVVGSIFGEKGIKMCEN